MKRYFRIFRIWYKGKLPYAKKVNRWIKGQFIRDLQELSKIYYPKILEKYGNENYTTVMEQLGKTNN
jgi:hypothetical protein